MLEKHRCLQQSCTLGNVCSMGSVLPSPSASSQPHARNNSQTNVQRFRDAIVTCFRTTLYSLMLQSSPHSWSANTILLLPIRPSISILFPLPPSQNLT